MGRARSGQTRPFFLCRRYLSSRSVSRQVFSAQVSLTAVFGMGTGGPSPQSTPTHFSLKRKVSKRNFHFLLLTVLFNDKVFYSIFFSLSRETFEVLSAFFLFQEKENGDPCGNRTHVCGVRGRRLSRLTNGPCGAPSRIRTGDPLIKSQLLYQLS